MKTIYCRLYTFAATYSLDAPKLLIHTALPTEACPDEDVPGEMAFNWDPYQEDPKYTLVKAFHLDITPEVFALSLSALATSLTDDLLAAQVEARGQIANVEAALRQLSAPQENAHVSP